MPKRIFDHIDLRVPNLAAATPFYVELLPALGFTQGSDMPGWLQFYQGTDDGRSAGNSTPTAFFGVAEDPDYVANATRIAFWADTAAEVDRLGDLLHRIGAQNIEGPAWEDPGYYAVFFEDPCGNRLEVCHRKENHGQLPANNV
ncbi:MAG: VOC family protein [Candidatus Methylacidiphilales bacterium]|nr:VOC family protein [Candidatus Methylacidiphilales bacterium]